MTNQMNNRTTMPDDPPDTGAATTPLGMTITTKVTSADTRGAFAMIEYTAPPHFDGYAPHRHSHVMEVCYVVRGTLACTIGDATITASAGTSLLVPPGVLHIFWNPTPMPVTYLLCCCPDGTEQHVADLSAVIVANQREVDRQVKRGVAV